MKERFRTAQDEYKAAVKNDRFMNEGGEGYETSETKRKKMMALESEIFAKEWTADTFATRRAQWNSRIAKLGSKVSLSQVQSLEKELGFTRQELARAKEIHVNNGLFFKSEFNEAEHHRDDEGKFSSGDSKKNNPELMTYSAAAAMAKKFNEIGGFTKIDWNYRGGGSVNDMRPEEYKKAKESSGWQLELWSVNSKSGQRNLYVVPFQTDSDKEIKTIARLAKQEAKKQDLKTLARIKAEKED